MIILGLNAYHADSSACLVFDGKLIAAAEEERFRRIKHWAGFPSEAIRYCLREAGIGLDDLHHVAINQNTKANFGRKIAYTLFRRPDLGLVLDRIRNKRKRLRIDAELEPMYPGQHLRAELHQVEHHLAHLASAFFVSPFQEAAAVSVDGFGDFSSVAWGIGRGNAIELAGKVFFPHSLGVFYEALTQQLGFPHYGDEYKVMGLAPYGEPRYLTQMRQVVQLKDGGGFELDLKYFRHARERVEYEWHNGEPVVGTLYTPALEELLGPARKKYDELTQRHRDIARSVQAMYEEAFFHLLNAVHARYRVDALALAGGCAMNSVANGKIYRQTPFRHAYVQSAAGDAGGAIGAAFVVWHKLNEKAGSAALSESVLSSEVASSPRSSLVGKEGAGGRRRFVMDHAYWGPVFSDREIEILIEARRGDVTNQGCQVERQDDEDSLCRIAALAVADGLVLGWFQGRMEWGPRALGNRSIVCDPRRADMKEILNVKIKRRESFRPFAPSILRESVAEWFETDDDVPFMMQVYQVRHEKRTLIPAVTHVDGSGRLQTVYRQTNPRYYRLIECFKDLTGIPIVLNTSFNENEPVVCQPEEALDCFLRTRMDLLVMGSWCIRRTK